MKSTAGEIEQASIEQLVREVLRRLDAPGGAPQGRTSERALVAQGGRRLTLTGRVVSLADVNGRLDGVNAINLARGAVLTPAARDYLIHRGVAISRGVEAGTTQPLPSVHALVLGVAETNYDPSGMVSHLGKRGTIVQQLARTGLASVVRETCDAVALGGQRGLLLTAETTAAVCMANRRQGVRAALANDSAAAEQAMRSVAANVLVTDPAKAGTFQLQRMAERLSQADLNPSATLARFLD